LRIHEHDPDRAIEFLPQNHVAGKQGPDVRVGLQGLTREMGVAGTDNHLRALLDAELGLERGLQADRGQHPDPSCLSASVTACTVASKPFGLCTLKTQELMTISP
jgi:hypothetical protein